jgi:putative transposase
VKAVYLSVRSEPSRALTRPGKETPPIKEQSIERVIESRPSWEDVEAFARQRIQTWFQRLLEEEVEELLERARYARRDGIDTPGGYRNGLGKPRRLTLSAGTITICC